MGVVKREQHEMVVIWEVTKGLNDEEEGFQVREGKSKSIFTLKQFGEKAFKKNQKVYELGKVNSKFNIELLP